ncbi:UPF0259 membrane protein Spro_2675 [Serratia symbiotica]|nr:UPF0259 membrane protein Spro_2675 [Serratia symbiotica]
MPITSNILYRDSFNFFRNQLINILIISLLTAFISVTLNQIFGTDNEILKILHATQDEFSTSTNINFQKFIQKMTPEQQLLMLKISAAATFSALIGYTILIGGILTLLRLVSQGENISALRAIYNSFPILPRLLSLLFICSLLIQLGLTLFIIPGIIMAIAFSFASIITINDKKSIFTSIKLSCKLAFINIRIIIPAMIFWLIAKLCLLFILSKQSLLIPSATNLVFTTLSNLISTLLIIYLFRLYMLLYNYNK